MALEIAAGTVRFGMQGYDVARVQQALRALGSDIPLSEAERAETIDLSKTVPISGIKLRPLKHEVLNLVAPAKLEPVAVKYAILTNALAAAITDDEGEREDPLAKLADACEIIGTREMNEQRNISFLHDATSWDARLIALAHDTHGTVDRSETEGTVDVSVDGPALRVRRTTERIIGS
jgi:hypothetical protein